MTYVKNNNPGQIRMDLPTANYIYELSLLSIGDVHGPFNLSLVFNRTMAKNQSNPFAMAVGYKLNVHKVLNFDDASNPYLLDANGNRVKLNENAGIYTFTDDSQRILRSTNATSASYVIENSDFSMEYYNQFGYITSIVDKYGVEVLAYSYNASRQLTSITFRGEKQIQFTYSNGVMATVQYQGSSYSTSLTLGAAATTVVLYSGETYNLVYSESTGFQASTTVAAGTSTVAHMVKVETTSTTSKITRLIAGEEVETTTYAFPGSESYVGEKFNQVEITNNEGVKTRVQYQSGNPLYAYEIGTDAEFLIDGTFAGTVKLLAAQDHPSNHTAAGAQTLNDGLPMVYNESLAEWSTDVTQNAGKTGYYTLSGWIKSENASITSNNVIIGTSSSNHVCYAWVDLQPVGQWKYFSCMFDVSANSLVAFPEVSGENISMKDFRITFQETGILDSGDTSHTDMTAYVLKNSALEIPFDDAVFYYINNGAQTVIENVTPSDVLRYKLRKKRTGSCSEMYYNNCKGIVTNVPELKVQFENTPYSVSDFDIAVRTYSHNNEHLSKMCIDEGDTTSNIVVENSTNGTLSSTQALSVHQDVLSVTKNGVTTTYTRNAEGLVTKESVGSLYSRSTTYGTDSSGNTTITMTDEFGEDTVYTFDPVWGIVKSVTLPNNTVVTDEYDDDMCAMTKRTFGSATGRSNSFGYSGGNLSSLQANDLGYSFAYSEGKLNTVSKNGTQIEEHTHEMADGITTANSYYPSQASNIHSTLATFDKYGRLTAVDGVLTNAYDLWPAFSSSTGEMTAKANNASALLGMTTDEIRSQVARFDYNKKGLLETKTVTSETNFANEISTEAFTYDQLNRLTEHTASYNGAGFESVSGVVTYEKGATEPLADNTVASYAYKVGGSQKAKTTNSFDSYMRLSSKTMVLGTNTFTKRFTYNKTRVSHHSDAFGTQNLGTNTYGYDSLGRVISDTYSSASSASDYRTYTYDQYGQLIRENNQALDKSIVYEYDNSGNLTNVKSYDYTQNTELSGTPATTSFGYTADKLTSFGGITIAYNAMGCPTSYDGKTATWSKGKLSRLSSGAAETGTRSYTYGYDTFGQRVSRGYVYTEPTTGLNPIQTGAVTRYSRTYYYDHAGRLIAEAISKTLYGEGIAAERIVFLYDENSIIGMEFTTGGVTSTYYFQRDLLGNVVAIFDTSGNLKAKYIYDAWGNCTISSETTDYTVAHANPIRYRGYYYDEDTGLYYCNARYYSPKWRRFISPDDTAYLDPESVNGLNLYCYCNNDPVNLVDPSGHKPEWWQWLLGSIGLALVAVAAGMAFIGTGGVAAFGMGALIGAAAVGGAGALVGGAIGYATGGTEGILGGALTGFGIGAIIGFAVGGSINYAAYVRSTVLVDGKRVSVYRGGKDLTLKPNEYKILKDGTKRGLSVNTDPAQVQRFGGAYRVKRIPRGLKIVQQGKNLSHYEIIPNDPLTSELFQELINKIVLKLV